MLDLVFAVFLPALGAAIVFDIGASTGGTDIVALILAKYTSMEIGKALMASDILIVLAAAWRFGMGTGLYCILGLIGKSFVVDGAIENIKCPAGGSDPGFYSNGRIRSKIGVGGKIHRCRVQA